MATPDDFPSSSSSATPVATRPGLTSSSSGYFSSASPGFSHSQPRRPTGDSGTGTHTRFATSTTQGRSHSHVGKRRTSSRAPTVESLSDHHFSGDEDGDEFDSDERGRGRLATADDDVPTPLAEDGEGLHSSREFTEDDPLTLKDRQSLLNAEHPFGLPLWKPALYKKSRTVTRNAETALHSVPGASTEWHLNVGNILWTLFFGWWIALIFLVASIPIWLVESMAERQRHASVLMGLGWYLFYPFGKYVEGDNDSMSPESLSESGQEDEEAAGSSTPTQDMIHGHPTRQDNQSVATVKTIKAPPPRRNRSQAQQPSSGEPYGESATERTSLRPNLHKTYRSYGALSAQSTISARGESTFITRLAHNIARILFWTMLTFVVSPLMIFACLSCWGLVFSVPMAKLNWELLVHLYQHPLSLRFRSPPPSLLVPENQADGSPSTDPTFVVKRPRLAAGVPAPSGRPRSVVLLCIYRAIGSQYYKYTVGGVNILFVNTLPSVFLVILDGWILLPWVEKRLHQGLPVPHLARILANQGLIFVASITSVIPLSYFIGMAVASISAQSSIGMGAVINATFGSIIEIILYGIALTQGKGLLVEGSIVGSILAGVLLMPGLSMMSSAWVKKESKFNAKSAGVTSTMLVMAMIGVLAPTMFYQIYGNFELVCDGCPPFVSPVNGSDLGSGDLPWRCRNCWYQHPSPTYDPFYQKTVKPFMYFCASVLLLSYLIGLWFSLRTHASQIWQNPQKLLHPSEAAQNANQNLQHSAGRNSFYHKILGSTAISNLVLPTHNPLNLSTNSQPTGSNNKPRLVRKASVASNSSMRSGGGGRAMSPTPAPRNPPNSANPAYQPGLFTPIIESVDQAVRGTSGEPGLLELPRPLTTEDFARAVTVATVSALRHQQAHPMPPMSPARGIHRTNTTHHEHDPSGGHGEGGHGGPSWSRTTSTSVLLTCTVLYAAIAEILVDVVDVVLKGVSIQEKFLGITVFALVPNTTEFMNAMSFAINGNIALSMEIGSAYALQVCLLQIPAMVAFSAWYDPMRIGNGWDTFTLIFPRWDVIAIVLAIFLLTYTYIEAKSNYHRGSILVLSYLVLTAGFFFAPAGKGEVDVIHFPTIGNGVKKIATNVFYSLWTR